MAPARASDPSASLKELAARAAAGLVQDGMAVGLGTGSTVAHLLSALGERAGRLRRARCAATSPETAHLARKLGLSVVALDELIESAGELDVAIDGADEVDEAGWLVKGGGGAHTREKIVVAAARSFVVIVSEDKLVPRVRGPVPLEVMEFGAYSTLRMLGDARLRMPGERGVGTGNGAAQRSPDGNLLAWYEGPVEDPRELAQRLSDTPGVVEHGLFAPEMVSEVIVGSARGVSRRRGAKPRS